MSDVGRSVEISGGKGVVVGDYATVFQAFLDGTRPLVSSMRTAQFRPLIDERTRTFVGRDFVFAGIDRILSSEAMTSSYIIVRGEPGIGKTAVAAALVLRRGYVHHFNIAHANIHTAQQFLENVCAQLIVQYDLDHQVLPPAAGSDAGFFTQLLAEAADRCRDRGELPLVVVVDALDEADDEPAAMAANRLYLPRVLPDGVFLVVTTRESIDYRLDVDQVEEIWINDDDPANREDVKEYIEQVRQSHVVVMAEQIDAWQISPAQFVEELTSLSQGNFMYLVHVLREIVGGHLTLDEASDIRLLPLGLRGYYDRHWARMKDADTHRFSRCQRPVLCFMAIGSEPVTVPKLADWTGLDRDEVNRVIQEWREFLNEDRDCRPRRYRLYHRSFAEFLDDVEDLRWYHDQIGMSALGRIPGFLDNPM